MVDRPTGAYVSPAAAKNVAPGGRTPVVSVVIPYHNEGNLLKRSVESVWDQQWDEAADPGGIKIVISDDGSTVPLPDLGEGRWPLTVVRSEISRYAGAARNLGAKVARGDFLAFLDADDVYLPTRLQGHAARLRTHGGAVCCGSPHIVRQEGADEFLVNQAPGGGWEGALPASLAADLTVKIPFATIAFTIPRSVFLEIGGFEERFHWGEEWDLLVRLATAGAILFDPQPGAVYLMREGSICSTPNPLKQVSEAEMAEQWLKNHPALPVSHRRRLRQSAHVARLLAAQEYWERAGEAHAAFRQSIASFVHGLSVWGLRSFARYSLAVCGLISPPCVTAEDNCGK